MGAARFRSLVCFLRAHTACRTYEADLPHLPLYYYRGAYRVPLLISLSVRLSVCVTFVFFTDYESCTRPISTNPESVETRECGLTRETCFVVCRLEVVAVAGLLWNSWCVLGAAGFRVFHAFAFSNS